MKRRGSNRIGRVALLGVLAAALLAPAAHAAWEPVPGPGGEIEEFAVADAETWLARIPASPCCVPQLRFTKDGGSSWSSTELDGFSDAFLAGAAADGIFRVVAWRDLTPGGEQEMQVFRVDASGAAQPLGPAVDDISPLASHAGAAVSEAGATWVPFRNDSAAKFTLARVAADGALASVELPESGSTQRWTAQTTLLGPRLLRYTNEGVFSGLFGGTYALEGNAVTPAEAYPVGFADGDFWLSRPFGRASWDGGGHWTESDSGSPVPRSPGLGQPRFLAGAGGIAERYSAVLFRRSGLALPNGAVPVQVVDAGSALIGWSETGIVVHEGPLPQFPLAFGQLQPDTLAMLNRANQFRADAGLPPLSGDELVSQAARNHSFYTKINGQDPTSAHHETEGRPGFTGSSPDQRCAFVDSLCTGEVMYSTGELDPVAGWLATPFHRALLGAPESGVVGAGRVNGGSSVADYQRPANLLVGPLGYPNGIWRGRGGFEGERPDPVARCLELGQPISYPVGIAVTLYSPVPYGYGFNPGPVTSIEVRRRGATAPLPGCLLGVEYEDTGTAGMFVLDDPLVEGEAYDVRGTWITGSDIRGPNTVIPGIPMSHEWSFRFVPDLPEERLRKRGSRQRCMGKRATRVGTAKRDVLIGTRRRDVIAGLGGRDSIRGLGGSDLICGGGGNDRILGGKGGDRLFGEKGRDRLFGGPGRDLLHGGAGRDLLRGGPQRDTLRNGNERSRGLGGRR